MARMEEEEAVPQKKKRKRTPFGGWENCGEEKALGKPKGTKREGSGSGSILGWEIRRGRPFDWGQTQPSCVE